MAFAKSLLLLGTFALFGVISSSDLNNTMPTVREICALAPGAIILRPDTCNRWIRCPAIPGSKDFEEGACVLGLYFEKDEQKCKAEDQVACPYLDKGKEESCERQPDGTYLADPQSCSGYIFCRAGKGVQSSCPSNLVFDPTKSACVYKQDYNCTIGSQENFKYDSPICRSVANNVTFADDEDCTIYHTCMNGQVRSYTCGKNEGYNYLTHTCVPQANVTCHPTALAPEPESSVCEDNNSGALLGPIATNESCSAYYYCKSMPDHSVDRHPDHFQCEGGYFFDAQTMSCRDRLNVKCSADRCEGMGDKYANMPGNCTGYLRCKNGVTVGKGYCPQNFYFDERSQICTAQQVNYAACAA